MLVVAALVERGLESCRQPVGGSAAPVMEKNYHWASACHVAVDRDHLAPAPYVMASHPPNPKGVGVAVLSTLIFRSERGMLSLRTLAL